MRYALLVTNWQMNPTVRRYQGEEIGALVNIDQYDPNYKLSETEALNLLGAKGYDIYDVEKVMDGQIPATVFRLKAKSE